VKKLLVFLCFVSILSASPMSAIAGGIAPGTGTSAAFSWTNPGCPAEQSSRNSLFGKPNLYFGWLEYSRGSNWILQRQNMSSTASWPLKGFWLGATEEITLGDGLGLLAAGSVFFPRRSAGTWYASPATGTYDFEVPSYDWWSLDLLAKYSVSGAFDLLAGFRWDHTSTRLKYSDNTVDDYILNLYLPLVGAQLKQRSEAAALTVRLLLSPIVPGRIRYCFWDKLGYAEFGDFAANSGYLLEAFADYSFRITSDLDVGGFARWNSVRVKTEERSLSGSAMDPVSWNLDIRSWTIGGMVSLGFSSPL
jgi:hypothetical protein